MMKSDEFEEVIWRRLSYLKENIIPIFLHLWETIAIIVKTYHMGPNNYLHHRLRLQEI